MATDNGLGLLGSRDMPDHTFVAIFAGSLPPNHDMSPAPTERLPHNPWADYPVEVDLENCPHCGKPLSE